MILICGNDDALWNAIMVAGIAAINEQFDKILSRIAG
jgi:hypothetical protein